MNYNEIQLEKGLIAQVTEHDGDMFNHWDKNANITLHVKDVNQDIHLTGHVLMVENVTLNDPTQQDTCIPLDRNYIRLGCITESQFSPKLLRCDIPHDSNVGTGTYMYILLDDPNSDQDVINLLSSMKNHLFGRVLGKVTVDIDIITYANTSFKQIGMTCRLMSLLPVTNNTPLRPIFGGVGSGWFNGPCRSPYNLQGNHICKTYKGELAAIYSEVLLKHLITFTGTCMLDAFQVVTFLNNIPIEQHLLDIAETMLASNNKEDIMKYADKLIEAHITNCYEANKNSNADVVRAWLCNTFNPEVDPSHNHHPVIGGCTGFPFPTLNN